MRTITLTVSPRGKVSRRLLRAFDGEAQGAFISFESPTLLFKVLTGKRWELLKLKTGAGAMTIRETARRLGRGVKAAFKHNNNRSDPKQCRIRCLNSSVDHARVAPPLTVNHLEFLIFPFQGAGEGRFWQHICSHLGQLYLLEQRS